MPDSTFRLPGSPAKSPVEAAFEQAAIGIAIVGGDGRIVHANPLFCRLIGYEAIPYGEIAIQDLIHPADWSSETAGERRWLRRSGELFWAWTTTALLGEGPDRVVTLVDVTAKRLEFENLRKTEEIYRVAAQHSSDVIFEWDTRTDRVTLHGPGSLGFREHEIPASFAEWCRMIHPADLDSVQHAIRTHYETREVVPVRHRVCRPDGTESLIEVRGSAFWNPSGDCSTWIGIISDITGQAHSEDALSQLAAIVQSSEDAIVGCDLDCRIVSWNAGAERLYGYAEAEVIGRPLSLLVPERPDQIVGQTEPEYGEHSVRRMESIHMTRNGSCPVSVSISPVLRIDGQLSGFSLISHDISERKRIERRLLYQALHDALTGLPNRRQMLENLDHAISTASGRGRMAGVFFIDIDGFKNINDTLGHVIGDQLLRAVAARLRSCARRWDMLSRAGGDEFVLTVNGLRGRHFAQRLAAKLIDCLRAPFLAAGNEISIAASIGVSLFPEDGDDSDSLLRNADAAMYQAKRDGKNQVRFFSSALSDTLRQRMEVANGLRGALENDEFRLYFQPVVSTADRRVIRFEALLRWRPPAGADISPADFIPISEETGQIVPIGKWVLKEACRRAAAWQDGPYRGVGVSVNVSPVQLDREDFVATLSDTLSETGLDPGLLELELTESVFVRNPRETASTISRLHALGVTMALDDFGTGYSSLGYLKNLPMDALKIDRSFLAGVATDPSAVVLVESLVALAHSLGMRVVAEGVETREQHELLDRLSCDELQGYLFGKPSPDPGSVPSRPLFPLAGPAIDLRQIPAPC